MRGVGCVVRGSGRGVWGALAVGYFYTRICERFTEKDERRTSNIERPTSNIEKENDWWTPDFLAFCLPHTDFQKQKACDSYLENRNL